MHTYNIHSTKKLLAYPVEKNGLSCGLDDLVFYWYRHTYNTTYV